MLHPHVTRFVRTLIASTWSRWRARLKRERAAFQRAEKKVETEYQSASSTLLSSTLSHPMVEFTASSEVCVNADGKEPTVNDGIAYIRAIRALVNRLNKWKTTHGSCQNRAEELQERLCGMEETLRKEPHQAAASERS